jgi:hypothetical protein
MKTGGRAKGTPNKKTQLVQQQMEDLGFDPIESMIEICNQAMTDKNYALAGQMAKELAQYVYPKRKAVEHITDEPVEWPKITINITDDPKPFLNSSAAKML